MSIPLFLPLPEYVPRLKLKTAVTLRQLCQLANVPLRASGPWTERQLEILTASKQRVLAEPGEFGKVKLYLKAGSKAERAQLALGILAYVLHDLAAKESIRGISWSRIPLRSGRPRSGKALLNKERQQRFRARQARGADSR